MHFHTTVIHSSAVAAPEVMENPLAIMDLELSMGTRHLRVSEKYNVIASVSSDSQAISRERPSLTPGQFDPLHKI
jgi:hypothetical protein